jgi:hypothetical protein
LPPPGRIPVWPLNLFPRGWSKIFTINKSDMNGSIPLPPVLAAKLSDFRRRVWLVKLLEGVLAAVFGLAVSYLLVLLLDRVMETPVWLRGTLLALGAAVPGIGLPLKWHRWVWRQRRLEDAARLLRWKFPRLGDQLLGIVELAKQDGSATGRSERLVQAAMAQADEAVKAQDFSGAVPQAKHRQWAWAAVGATALIVAGFVGINEAARNALTRWLMPWRDTTRFTFARVAPLPNPLIVPVAEPFTLPVELAGDTRWKPARAVLQLPGQPEVSAARADAAYQLAVSPQQHDADLSLKVGDVRQTVRLEPRPRPELTSLKVRLKLPDYLEYKTQPEIEVRGGAVSLLKGAQASFEATASRELVNAEIDGKPAVMRNGSLLSESQLIGDARAVTFTWKDSIGLTARIPLVLQVQPAADEAPKLVARRETLEQVVLDSEVVIFDVRATDDFGIRQVGLEWKGQPEGGAAAAVKTAGSKVASAGAPETKEVESRATFCAVREGIAPQTLEVRAWAEDYLKGRDRSHSAAFVLHVLNHTDHALWVTQQMSKWLEAARETYEREQQLHQTNKELRMLSAEELDRPENRRKVAQQAGAENANADRLSALNQAGRSLVEQATKNSEFDAPRLESWATMLKSLQDIAANRMPGVAGLLKQSADAKADGKLAKAGEPGQSQPAGDAKTGAASEGKPGEPNTAQTPPGATPPPGPDGKQGVPSESRSASTIAQGPQAPKGSTPPNPTDPNAKPKDPAPSIKLTESTMNKPDAPPADSKPGEPKPPGAGKLSLPTNSLAAAPGAKPDAPPPADSAAQKPLEAGVTDQKALLAEFAKVSDQLTEILASLEASTFVKRFKAASKEQTQLASGISQKTLDAFGVVRDQPGDSLEQDVAAVKVAGREEMAGQLLERMGVKPDAAAALKPKAEPKPEPEPVFVTTFAPEAFRKAKDQSALVKVIQSDLEAYFQRKPDQHFKKVLGEMKQIKVVSELGRVGQNAADNFSGNAMHGAEFWADTMDRWAEEMVAAGKCSNCSSCSGDSLPPEVVLKVMQALRDEMKLRDETRELETAQAALERPEYKERSAKLAASQGRIATHTRTAIDDIVAIEEGAKKFGKELKLLNAVVQVMAEAGDILGSPSTGSQAIAAETEAIELLLQTKRQKPGGGGGGGGDPGGGGTAASAGSAALADIGPGGDADRVVSARPVGQATGRAGREFPEEFKSGLDAYFSTLEGTQATP